MQLNGNIEIPMDLKLASIIQLEIYFTLASKALFIYDFLLMFEMEVTLIRRSSWNVVKFAYLLSRYTVFIDIALSAYSASLLTEDKCRLWYIITGWLYAIGISMSEAVLGYRLWIIWNKDRRLTYILPMLFCAFCGSGIIVMTRVVASISFTELPYPFDKGCYGLASNRTIWVIWTLILIYDTATLMLLGIRTILMYWSFHHSAFLKLYRDGLAYYFFLFLISVINVIVIFSLPEHYANLLSGTVRTLHSNLSSRVILDIYRDTDGTRASTA